MRSEGKTVEVRSYLGVVDAVREERQKVSERWGQQVAAVNRETSWIR